MCDCVKYAHFRGDVDEVAMFLVEAGRPDLSDKLAGFLTATLRLLNAQAVMVHVLEGHDGD